LCDHDTGDGFEHSDFAVEVQDEAGTVDYQAGPSSTATDDRDLGRQDEECSTATDEVASNLAIGPRS